MENTKAKKVIIAVLVILLIGSFGIIIWQQLTLNQSIKELSENNAGQSESASQQETTVDKKDEEVNVDQVENETKKEEDKEEKVEQPVKEVVKVETVIKNEYVPFNPDKVKVNGKYTTETCVLYPTSVSEVNNSYQAKINSEGGIEIDFYYNKSYTVSGLTKKAVELYAVSDGQTAVEGVIAIMEDGTIEQMYFDGKGFVTRGTIEGVKDVVRLTYIRVGGHRQLVAIQANGDAVALQGLKNYYNPGT